MASGQETSLAPPFSNLSFFGSKSTAVKKVLATLLGLFGNPQWFGARGIVPLLPPPRYVPDSNHCTHLQTSNSFRQELMKRLQDSKSNIPRNAKMKYVWPYLKHFFLNLHAKNNSSNKHFAYSTFVFFARSFVSSGQNANWTINDFGFVPDLFHREFHATCGQFVHWSENCRMIPECFRRVKRIAFEYTQTNIRIRPNALKPE